MPLPQDERIVSLANDLLHAFDKVFGLHPGFRPAHAKGVMLTGVFVPAAGAQHLTKAPHLTKANTPVTVRFSNSTGLPSLPDTSPDANPHGLAIRFHLAEHVHTDIIAHSENGFPAHNGQEFLELLEAIATSGPDVPSPKPIEQFFGSHPSALAFVQAPKPFPSSLARDTYFGVTAYRFTNAAGETKFGRYRVVPEQGNDYISSDKISGLSTNYHFEELVERVAKEPIRFKILLQVAGPSDNVNDATIPWPEDRELVELGTFELTEAVPDNLAQQKNIIFDPIPRVDGIEPSDDPLLEVRSALYLLSGRRRREAESAVGTSS